MKEKLNTATGKKVLSLVRNGNYAHPGEEEAIELAFSQYKKDGSRRLLDIGCGLFGTAKYLESHGYGKVTGIDVNEGIIKVAKERYPDADIYLSGAENVHKVINEKFNLIYMFNSFYIFPKQFDALAAAGKVIEENGELIIFDYADPGNYDPEDIEVPTPLKLDEIEKMLSGSGWSLISMVDITDKYIKWYQGFCSKIRSCKEEIAKLVDFETFEYVLGQYSKILRFCEEGSLKGVIVRAKTK